jgi:hypothetical protein
MHAIPRVVCLRPLSDMCMKRVQKGTVAVTQNLAMQLRRAETMTSA